MKLSINYRDTCRVCGARNLYLFLDLPNMPIPAGHIHPDSGEKPFLTDLRVYWCPVCGVVQTLHDVDLSDYYTDYSYTVSFSPFVQKFMKRFAEEVWEGFGLSADDIVIEVGSGDGYQMKCFNDLGARVLGFEPSSNLAEKSREIGVETIKSLFTSDTVEAIPTNMRPVRAVIIQYTFDHLPDPVDFLRAVSKVLDPKCGVIVIEVHDFEKMVERREACLFTHEHSIYLSTASFFSVFVQAGFRMVRTDLVPENMCRGNSLIVAGTLIGSQFPSVPPRRSKLLDWLCKQESYTEVAASIWRSHGRLASRVREMRASGKRVAGYGAAGRGINTLAIAGLTGTEIEYVCDMNPKLHGLIMPGVGITVVPPEQLLRDPVDEVIVFSYGYIDEIKKYLAPYIESGGRIVSVLEYLREEDGNSG